MLKITSICVTAFALAALTACNSAPPAPVVDVSAEQAKIRDLEANWVKETLAKDLDKIVAHYTDDGIFMMSGAPAAKGKDAIRGAWKGMVDAATKVDWAPDVIEISQSGDMASVKGSYSMTIVNPKTKKPVDDKGSYVTVYKKQADGSWKATEDIAVSEVAN
jgi:uncharacterized protein (TIGR02246 family)